MDERLYEEFFELEDRHWWFIARRSIIGKWIRDELRLPPGSSVLDVGCGTGGILADLSSEYQTCGTDTSPKAIELAQRRGVANVHCCTLATFPFPDRRFDLITLLDVIEHVDDDVGLLTSALHLLRENGKILVTVPAYQFLWSRHDDLNHHRRRYTLGGLRRTMKQAGLHVERGTYFNTLLFLPALVQRLASRFSNINQDSLLDLPSAPLNSFLKSVFRLEQYIIPSVSLPFGLSILAVVQKEG
ncbi:MAG: class I SAM-dependent methyltransferase [Ignavibacteriales bacterium]|nr:class I SAM-dependent methyltransferase [Ignavibacteriales bacterium]